MKHVFPLLALMCVPFVVVWLFAGFIAWNWNPEEWGRFWRFYVAFIGACCSVCCAIEYFIRKSTN